MAANIGLHQIRRTATIPPLRLRRACLVVRKLVQVSTQASGPAGSGAGARLGVRRCRACRRRAGSAHFPSLPAGPMHTRTRVNSSTQTTSRRRLVGLLAAERALDTVVWQMLASVIIPGYTIHTVVAVAHALLVQVGDLGRRLSHPGPLCTAVLACCALALASVDHLQRHHPPSS